MMSKVQKVSPLSLLILTSLAVLMGLLASGCEDAPVDVPEPPNEEEDVSGFGTSYRIVTNPTQDAPETLPHVRDDSLFMNVSYLGGCENHSFSLGHHIQQDTAQLWVYHNAGGETCSTRVADHIALPLPEEVRGASTLRLRMPQGSPPYTLRFNQ